MAKTFTVKRELVVNPIHQLTSCTDNCECGYYYYPEQLGGDGRVAGFRGLRSNGGYARFRSYSGAYKFGKRYFGED